MTHAVKIHEKVKDAPPEVVANLDRRIKAFRDAYKLYSDTATRMYARDMVDSTVVGATPELYDMQRVDVEAVPEDDIIKQEVFRLAEIERGLQDIVIPSKAGRLIVPTDFHYKL